MVHEYLTVTRRMEVAFALLDHLSSDAVGQDQSTSARTIRQVAGRRAEFTQRRSVSIVRVTVY
jgi:hypothetical protein